MIISVDFDGTVVKHKFPNIGEDVGAVPILKQLIANGHKIILNTMRSNMLVEGRNTLQEAVDWFTHNDIELFGINENPTQHSWTNSPKPYANIIIDDAALGCPLTQDLEGNVFVDWNIIENYFKRANII